MEKNKPKYYDEEFKEQAARLVIETGKSALQVARELEINKNTIYGWITNYKKKHNIKISEKANTSREDKARIKKLEKELKEKEEELAILKKAMAIFSKDRN